MKPLLLIAMLTCGFTLEAAAPTCPGCTSYGLRIPISLAAGTVRTPQFPVKKKDYFIAIEVQWNIPDRMLQCKMGFAVVPYDDDCKWPPLIDVAWKVLDGDRTVAQGTSKGKTNNFDSGASGLRRYIGDFSGEAKHNYIVELTFLKDASELNVAKPELIVSKPEIVY